MEVYSSRGAKASRCPYILLMIGLSLCFRKNPMKALGRQQNLACTNVTSYTRAACCLTLFLYFALSNRLVYSVPYRAWIAYNLIPANNILKSIMHKACIFFTMNTHDNKGFETIEQRTTWITIRMIITLICIRKKA